MVMLCADCNQLKHPGTECQVPEEKPACEDSSVKLGGFNLWFFEATPHVCNKCGSSHWHANLFYENTAGCWDWDDPSFWCSDCEASVEITPLKEDRPSRQ